MRRLGNHRSCVKVSLLYVTSCKYAGGCMLAWPQFVCYGGRQEVQNSCWTSCACSEWWEYCNSKEATPNHCSSQILQIKPMLCLPTLPCFSPTTSVLLLAGALIFLAVSFMKLMGFIAYIALCSVGETCLNLKRVIFCIPMGSQYKKHIFAWSGALGIQCLGARLIACTWQKEQSK